MGSNGHVPALLRVVVVGGGIGGVLLLISLQKLAHIDAQLYESAPSFGEIGAGVAFGPNAQHALQMIDPRTWEVLKKLSSTNMWESHLHHFVVNRCVRLSSGIFTEAQMVRTARMKRKANERTLGVRTAGG